MAHHEVLQVVISSAGRVRLASDIIPGGTPFLDGESQAAAGNSLLCKQVYEFASVLLERIADGPDTQQGTYVFSILPCDSTKSCDPT